MYDYLNRLPAREAGGVTPYREFSYLQEGRRQFHAHNYRAAFEQFETLLTRVPDTDYEAEAMYHLVIIMPKLLESGTSYFSNYFAAEYTRGKYTNTREAFIASRFASAGIRVSPSGPSYSYTHVRSIVAGESFFPAKDGAYAMMLSNDMYIFTDGETNKFKFLSNTVALGRLSERFPASAIAPAWLADERLFPARAAHERLFSARERYEYTAVMRAVIPACEHIKPDTNIDAVVTATTVRLRDRITGGYAEFQNDKTILMLNDYDFVTILRIVSRPVPMHRTNEQWAFLETQTPYGPARGWTYLRYVTPLASISADAKVVADFRKGLRNYYDHEYVKAAEAFSLFLSRHGTNYFTDKACYLLWQANNIIGSYISSRNNEYYRYARRYPLSFIYDRKANTLRASNLLYRYLNSVMSNSEYRFKINNDFLLE